MTSLKLLIWDDAKEFIDSLVPKRKQQVAKKILMLTENHESSKTKILIGFEPLRRVRAGDYRIVYFISEETVNIVFIDNRNDDKVYCKLLRKMK